ncbi:hypothetical protein H9P43_003718 [Blastocladiella emersonii ATCC 22665]|nr:hypothetical protein H9P43_003718 [Blastocladiella emersonii ATCC 22665]
MRPDAHKQKASRRYQAAHRGAAGGEAAAAEAPRGRGQAVLKDYVAEEVVTADAEAAQDVQSDGRGVHSKFARRAVTSNAFRYEQPLPGTYDDDENSAAGATSADPSVLDDGSSAAKALQARLTRSALGGTGTFKFKDELVWDDLQDDSDPAAQEGTAAIDLNQLEALIAALPLEVRVPGLAPPAAEAEVQQMVQPEEMPVAEDAPVAPASATAKSRSRSRSKSPAKPAPAAAPRPPSPTRAAAPAPAPAHAPVPTPAPAAAPAKQAVASMEAWLDDFLDD